MIDRSVFFDYIVSQYLHNLQHFTLAEKYFSIQIQTHEKGVICHVLKAKAKRCSSLSTMQLYQFFVLLSLSMLDQHQQIHLLVFNGETSSSTASSSLSSVSSASSASSSSSSSSSIFLVYSSARNRGPCIDD